MSWGDDLWDKYDDIGLVTNKGIELLEKYGQFTKDLSAIENDYAAKLRKLVKNYNIKKKDDEDNTFTVIKAFNQKLSEVNDIAGQHEIIAEDLTLKVVKEISHFLKDLKDERKKHLSEGTRLQGNLHSSIQALEKSKRSYEKAFRESEKANENFKKADADLNLSRAELEKARNISILKSQMCEDAKSDYATHLQKTNELQRAHYRDLMPKVFHQLQDMEERRIQGIANFIKQSAHIRRSVIPIIEKCIDEMIRAADSIDHREDSRIVIEKYKTGMFPPDDFPFEDLSNSRNSDDSFHDCDPDSSMNGSSRNSSTLHHSTSIKETMKGTLSAAKFRKRVGIFNLFSNKQTFDDSKEDYSELPPNQRRKKIEQKLSHIQHNINQEKAVKEALIKMKSAFEENPKLGDPSSLDGQLRENENNLNKLQNEYKKFQAMLNEVVNGYTPASQKKQHSASISSGSNNSSEHRNSFSEGSLSRSGSENSVNVLANKNGYSNGQANGSVGNGSIASTLVSPSNGSVGAGSIVPNSSAAGGSLFKLATNGSIHTNGSQLYSPVSGREIDSRTSDLSKSHSSIPDADADSMDGEQENELEEVLGTCKALYPFEGQDEGSIKMLEGEEFEVVELDQGDGWTRVRRKDQQMSYEEGFVPTTYIQMDLFKK